MKEEKKVPFLCHLGLHWPMKGLVTLFVDHVNHQEVFASTCPCGKEWMHQSIFKLPIFKCERNPK